MMRKFKVQSSKFKVIIIFFVLAVLLGAGCAKGGLAPLTSDKVRSTLYFAANELGWTGDVIQKPPSQENYYGKSYILNGPFRQGESADEAVKIDNIEVIEFENPIYAKKSYNEEECFKGKGVPIKIYGIDACCLRDLAKGWSSVVMARDNFILRAKNYFHADCGAAEYLKAFWKSYDK